MSAVTEAHDQRVANAALMRQTIDRFVEAARQRSEVADQHRRRAECRYHRSWPLSIVYHHAGVTRETCVALHNASRDGVAFLAPAPAEAGTMVDVRVFWHDDNCPRIPAIVRHCTSTRVGYLVGCEFVVWDGATEDQADEEIL